MSSSPDAGLFVLCCSRRCHYSCSSALLDSASCQLSPLDEGMVWERELGERRVQKAEPESKPERIICGEVSA